MHGIEIATHGTAMRALPRPQVVPATGVRVGRAALVARPARRRRALPVVRLVGRG